MRFVVVAVLFPFLLLAQGRPYNGDFEQGTVGLFPTQWLIGGQNIDYRTIQVTTTDQGCEQGSKCAQVIMPANPPANSLGILLTTIAPSAFPSSSLRFRAAVRLGAGGQAALWVRVRRGDNSIVYMNSVAVGTTDWAYYTIETPVSFDSTIIDFGLLVASGTAWLDDVTVEILAPPVPAKTETPESPRALSAAGLNNLVAFAKLAGYVRYFHPSDQGEQLDWDTWVINGVRAVESASTPDELASRMRTLLDPIAPTVQVFAEGASPDLPPELKPASTNGLSVTRWQHLGLGAGMDATGTGFFSSRISAAVTNGQLPDGYMDPAQPYTASLGDGLTVRVPVSLYTDAQGTLPHRPSAAPKEFWSRDITDRGTRLADVIIAWNVFQNFYPYFDVETVDMPGELRKALTSAAVNTGAEDFRLTMQKTLVALKDGQASVSYQGRVTYSVPVVWAWVENQVIITRIRSFQGQNVHPGDRVLTIDGKDVNDRMAELAPLVAAATPQRTREQVMEQMLYCDTSKQAMQLEIEPYSAPGTRQTLNFTCFKNSPDSSETRPTANAQLESGMYYIDLTRIGQPELDTTMAKAAFQAATMLIFDLRGSASSWPPTILSHMVGATSTGEQSNYPYPYLPDQAQTYFYRSDWTVEPVAPRFTAKVVVLADARTIGWGEDYLNFIRQNKLGDIIGGPTAGTAGWAASFALPGGFHVTWTGLKVLTSDGAQFHGVGIQPNFTVTRTRKAIGDAQIDLFRDEVLAKAREIVKGPQSGPTPAITAAGIGNAASYQTGAVAPGEVVSIFGTNLASGAVLGTYDNSGVLTRYLGETRVLFDGIQAPLTYVSPTQVNAIVPYGVSGNTVVTVEYQLRKSNEIALPVAAAVPGIFAYPGGTRAVTVNEDFTMTSDTNAAARGHILTLFATGEGAVTPVRPDGYLPQVNQWPAPTGEVAVTFDGKPGTIVWKGEIYAGVLQINVRVPDDATTGAAVPMVVTVAGQASSQATVALK